MFMDLIVLYVRVNDLSECQYRASLFHPTMLETFGKGKSFSESAFEILNLFRTFYAIIHQKCIP